MHTVKVRMRKPTRVFTFICKDKAPDIHRHEHCIVRSDRGLEFGTVIVPPEECPPDTERRIKMQFVRKASGHDIGLFEQIVSEERQAHEICADKIKARGLPMKLVDTEYTFDKQKLVFYFTAEDRVDFRELVRDLARELKTRIELRHIQVRDQARIVGGIGVCGRELCCSTWLGEFKPISMKMAKVQNLSLNPSKISGQCGRLLCCLSYENELYLEAKKRDGRKEGRDKAAPEQSQAAATQEPAEKDRPQEAASGQAPSKPKRRRRRRKKSGGGGGNSGNPSSN